eukprot:CAMPEP_0171699488 /NCGR_PEP_ID=MMETSP0991-20121206/10003_1 /TAXON_ID=483369 /ORGANISM="non described non described, Strain CCMP2098" /LENGTH=153 /DNA_ID=CAMNT_0012288595 /DNA_START=349 /DNA_END=808 /DNA_ORIENTATION=-
MSGGPWSWFIEVKWYTLFPQLQRKKLCGRVQACHCVHCFCAHDGSQAPKVWQLSRGQVSSSHSMHLDHGGQCPGHVLSGEQRSQTGVEVRFVPASKVLKALEGGVPATSLDVGTLANDLGLIVLSARALVPWWPGAALPWPGSADTDPAATTS